eukprot:m.589688 g.589688  ORF g.589688 m.589688 type:complete len:100 (-) comp58009_c0_seq1:2563-2862(-)
MSAVAALRVILLNPGTQRVSSTSSRSPLGGDDCSSNSRTCGVSCATGPSCMDNVCVCATWSASWRKAGLMFCWATIKSSYATAAACQATIYSLIDIGED